MAYLHHQRTTRTSGPSRVPLFAPDSFCLMALVDWGREIAAHPGGRGFISNCQREMEGGAWR
jgi:hypothetical protein